MSSKSIEHLNHYHHNETFSYLSFAGWLYLIPTVLAVSAAMLCKEQGITICGVCAIYEIFVAQKVCTYVIYANIFPSITIFVDFCLFPNSLHSHIIYSVTLYFFPSTMECSISKFFSYFFYFYFLYTTYMWTYVYAYNVSMSSFFSPISSHHNNTASYKWYKTFDTECGEWKSTVAFDKLVAKWSYPSPYSAVLIDPRTSFCSS